MKRKITIIIFAMMLIFTVGSNLKEKKSNQIQINTDEFESVMNAYSDSIKNTDDTEQLTVVFIDVGQGDATLLTDGTNDILIDTGDYTAWNTVDIALNTYTDGSIEYLILTHPDSDHIGNADSVLMNYDVENVIMSDCTNDTETYARLMNVLNDVETSVLYPDSGDFYQLGDIQIDILAPINYYENTNANSICAKISYKNNSFLFTGDACEDEITDIVSAGYDITADVYKCAHHGSANDNSNSWQFMDMVNPQYAVISCKYQNSYGHPHRETVQYLKENAVLIYRTDLQGTFICVSDGNNLTWSTEPCDNYTGGSDF